MHGAKRETHRIDCHVCGKPQFVSVDLEDVARGLRNPTVPAYTEIFVDTMGKPYLTPYEAELLVSATCKPCWDRLCPTDKQKYN